MTRAAVRSRQGSTGRGGRYDDGIMAKLGLSVRTQAWQGFLLDAALATAAGVIIFSLIDLRFFGFTREGMSDFTKLMLALSVAVGSSRVDLQACKLEYSIVSPK